MNSTTIATMNGLNDAQVIILTQETPKALIRQRKGRGGKIFSYLPHEEVTRILNSAFGFNWDFRILQSHVTDSEAWVLGELTIKTSEGAITKQQFGQCDFIRNKSGEIVMPVGDCLKAAASDALTKTASLMGVGLDLYGVTSQERKSHTTSSKPDDNDLKSQVTASVEQLRGKNFSDGRSAFAYFKKQLFSCNGDKSRLEKLHTDIYRFLSQGADAV